MKDKKITLSEKEFKEMLNSVRERLESAEILLQNKKYRDSISRSYYAFFDIVAALLAVKGLIPRTHSGAIRLFSLHFVKKGIFPKEYGKTMRNLMEMREEADYEWKRGFSKKEAHEALKEAKDFFRIMESDIPKLFQ